MPEGAIHTPGRAASKCLSSLSDAIDATGLKNGATISFHHHLRNGDAVINTVVNMLAEAGLRDLHLAVTSLFPVHAPLVEHIRSGVIGRISASFISGPVGEAISRGALAEPATLRSHGGRARAIDTGEMPMRLRLRTRWGISLAGRAARPAARSATRWSMSIAHAMSSL